MVRKERNVCQTLVVIAWRRAGWQIAAANEDFGKEVKLDKEQSVHCLYVICLPDKHAMSYDGQLSSVLYIGQGQLCERLRQHDKWMQIVPLARKDTHLEIFACAPMVQVNWVHCDAEAYLIEEFFQEYGMLPVMNRLRPVPRRKLSYIGATDENSAPFIKPKRGNVDWILQAKMFKRAPNSRTSQKFQTASTIKPLLS